MKRKKLLRLMLSACLLVMLLMFKPGYCNVVEKHDQKNKGLPTASQLIRDIETKYPALKFKKGAEVNKSDYSFVNWNNKGGIQIFSKSNVIRTINILMVSGRADLEKKAMPISIEKLLVNTINKKVFEWYTEQLKVLSKSKLSSESMKLKQDGNQITISFEEHTSLLTVTIQAI